MSLIDDFNQLKLGVVGTKTSNIDKKLDLAVKDILQYKSNAGRLGYIDLMKNIITKSSTSALTSSSMGNNLFNQVASPSAFGQGQRLGRYKMYESIISYIGYCQRGLNVIVDNILSPDDITKTSLEVNVKKFLDDDSKSLGEISYIKELIDTIKLEKYLDLIVSSTLEYGDFFVEIADHKTALTSRAYLVENMVNLHANPELNDNSFIFENEDKNVKVKVKIDYSLMLEDDRVQNDTGNTIVSLLKNSDKDDKKDISEKDKKYLKNYTLALHDPSRVVKLQSELYPLCFGYLIFPKFPVAGGINIADQAINDICKNIIDNLAKKIPHIEDMEKQDEIKEIISNIIKETNSQVQMTIRFVPPDRIQHFQKPSVKNFPYGQSIFFGSEFDAKILISLETSLAVQRINRSTEKRKIAVEIGLPRDAQKMIQKLKEQFRKRKVSIDSYGSVDTLASSISSFEDIYIPMKDGKNFVDISTFSEGNVDIRSKVDELKFLRDSLVAGIGVPPSFVGIEENLCLGLDTKIPLTDGRILTLQEIIDLYEKDEEPLEVYSFDTEKSIIFANKILWAGITRKNTELYRIYIDNGEYFDCTYDHPIMLRDGSYIQACELQKGYSLMPLYTEYIILNHKVLKIEKLEGTFDTGDITVDTKFHNFAIKIDSSGIFVHNSNKSALTEENILFARMIVNYQKFVGAQTSELIQKLVSIVDPEKATYIFDNISIVYAAPKSLQYERQSRYITDMSNLCETLERLGVPKSYSVKKYLTDIDWMDLKNYKTDTTIDQTLGTEKSDDNQFGGGGMGY